MKFFKKFILVVLTLVLALSAISLSFANNVNAADDSTEQESAETGPKVFVTPKWTNKVINNKTKIKDYKEIGRAHV